MVVYCGLQGEMPVEPRKARWRRELAAVLYDLGRRTPDGRVYRATVTAGGVRNVTPLPLVSLAQMLPVLRDKEVLAQYAACREREGLAAFFSQPDGIHGVAHAQRVLVHTLLLAAVYDVSPADRALLVKAALYHDIGRESDGPDERHGIRSTVRMQELGLFAPLAEQDCEMARFVINNHCISDAQAVVNLQHYDLADRDKAVRLLHLFKDADGLERVRIHDLDPAYLRTPYARTLPLLACQLLYHWSVFADAAGVT